MATSVDVYFVSCGVVSDPDQSVLPLYPAHGEQVSESLVEFARRIVAHGRDPRDSSTLADLLALEPIVRRRRRRT